MGFRRCMYVHVNIFMCEKYSEVSHKLLSSDSTVVPLGRISSMLFHQQWKEQSLPASRLLTSHPIPFPCLPGGGMSVCQPFGCARAAPPACAGGANDCGLARGEGLNSGVKVGLHTSVVVGDHHKLTMACLMVHECVPKH